MPFYTKCPKIKPYEEPLDTSKKYLHSESNKELINTSMKGFNIGSNEEFIYTSLKCLYIKSNEELIDMSIKYLPVRIKCLTPRQEYKMSSYQTQIKTR